MSHHRKREVQDPGYEFELWWQYRQIQTSAWHITVSNRAATADKWAQKLKDYRLNVRNPDNTQIADESLQKSDHKRIMHFRTNSLSCLGYIRSGVGTCADLPNSISNYPDHTATLVMTNFSTNSGSEAMTKEPFYQAQTSHWNIHADFGTNNSDRWEMRCADGYAADSEYAAQGLG